MATCIDILCCQVDPALGDFSGFSIVGGDFPGGTVQGNPESSFVIDCPPGIVCEEGTYPVTVIIDKDRVTFPYGPPVNNGLPLVIRVPCGLSEVVRYFPAGTSQATIITQITDAIQICAGGLATDEAISAYGPQTPQIPAYANAALNVPCATGKKINLLSAWSGYPGFTYNSASKTIDIAAGIFTSDVSVAAANTQATNYATNTVIPGLTAAGNIQCGYWNTEQSVVCEFTGETKTTPADTHFSTVSQDAADAAALAAAQDECPVACDPVLEGLSWAASVVGGSGSGSGDGPYATGTHTGTGSTTVVSDTFSTPAINCTLQWSYTITGGSTIIQLKAPVGGTLWSSGLVTGSNSGTSAITIPLSGSQNLQWVINGSAGVTAQATALVAPT